GPRVSNDLQQISLSEIVMALPRYIIPWCLAFLVAKLGLLLSNPGKLRYQIGADHVLAHSPGGSYLYSTIGWVYTEVNIFYILLNNLHRHFTQSDVSHLNTRIVLLR